MRKLFALLALLPMLAIAQTYTTFPNLQSGNVNFTATIRANGGACSSGQAIVSGSGTVSCTAVIPASEKGANNGVATLDSGGKVPTAQLPFTGLSYEGSWNANTNSPTLADGVGTGGDFYIANVAGTQDLGSGNITFAVGDWALYSGSIWQKVPSSAAVSSVFGRTGAVTATAGDYSATLVTNTPAGGIAATTVQAAVNELDTEKQIAAATLTSWAALTRASGFDTFTQTPSSANLRGLLTDEVGTGAAYFVGGALGTPASVTLSNGSGLPWSTGLTGVPTTAVGYGITGGAKLDAYAGGDTPSAFTLGIVDSADSATWRSALGAGTSSFNGDASTLTGTLADARLSSNVPLKNAANAFTGGNQFITAAGDVYLDVSGGGTGTGTGLFVGDFSGSAYLWQRKNLPLLFGTNNTARGEISAAGNWTINAPGSGTSLSVSSAANEYVYYGGTGTIKGGMYTSSAGGAVRFGAQTNHALDFFTNDIVRGAITNAGNWTINAPSNGPALTVVAAPTVPLEVNAAGVSYTQWSNLSAGIIGYYGTDSGAVFSGSQTAHPFDVYTNNAHRFRISAAGGATINTPTSAATALTVNGRANDYAQQIISPGTSSQSYGLSIQAGTDTADYTVAFSNAAGANAFIVRGDRSVILGVPTGGGKGAGTINTAGGIYQNNVAVALSTDLSSLNASNLTSGTVPDARFPATLPAVSGVNLTALTAANISAGTAGISITGNAATATKSYIPRRTSGLADGELLSTSSGVTVNTSDCSAGRTFSILNSSGSSITITQGSGMTLYNTNTAATGTMTLSARGMATMYCDTGTAAYVGGQVN